MTTDSEPTSLHSIMRSLCWPDHWCLDRVYGEHPGYLIRLYCQDDHIHHAALVGTYAEAHAAMCIWREELLGDLLPGAGWFIDDLAKHLRINPDGRQWPLRDE